MENSKANVIRNGVEKVLTQTLSQMKTQLKSTTHQRKERILRFSLIRSLIILETNSLRKFKCSLR